MVISVEIRALSRPEGLQRIIWITPSGNWSRVTRWMMWILKRGHKSREVSGTSACVIPVLFQLSMTQRQRSICLEINSSIFLLYVWEWASLTPVQVQPSLFSPRELYSLKALAWKASHRSRHNPNLEKSNENVKRCPSGTGKGLPLTSSSLLWRSVYSHGVCGCVLLFGVIHVSIFFFFRCLDIFG